MDSENLKPNRGTKLRKNYSKELKISIDEKFHDSIFLINENEFLTDNITPPDLKISPGDHYMIINKGKTTIPITYNMDISDHKIIYDPYKYENAKKKKIDPENFQKHHEVPKGFIDILPKWYSIKFTYPDYNLIFIKPEMGISFQLHQERSEKWEIIFGNPIILKDHTIYYYVDSGEEFTNAQGIFHSVINTNKKSGDYVVFKERWGGNFDEQDIKRVFNPNHYSD